MATPRAALPDKDLQELTLRLNNKTLEDLIKDNNSSFLIAALNSEQAKIFYSKAVKMDGSALEFVPGDQRDFELCFSAVTQNCTAIKYVPENLSQYYDLCLIAIESKKRQKQNDSVLDLIGSKWRDYQLCLAAVAADGLEIKYVPSDLIDDRLREAAFKENYRIIDFMPDFLNETRAAIAIEQSALALKYIPETYSNYAELCLEAVKDNSYAIRFVKKAALPLETYKALCLTAVERNFKALKLIPKDLRTSAMCITAIKQDDGFDNDAIKNVPFENFENDKSAVDEICNLAIQKNGLALAHVPEKLRERELCLKAVKSIGLALESVPEKWRDLEMCFEAVKRTGAALQFVPKELLNEDFYFAAVSQNGLALKFVPPHHRTPKLCGAAVNQNGKALKFVPKNTMHEEMTDEYRKLCIDAVSQNPMALKFVPDILKSAMIDELSVERILTDNFAALKYFPSDIDYQSIVSEFLSRITNIVVTDKKAWSDYEVKDSFLVYANAKKREGKTLHINVEDLSELLNQLTMHNHHQLNLVLLGHANEETQLIGGMHYYQLLDHLFKHPTINNITMLGCRSVQAKKLPEEVALIEAYAKSASTRSFEPASFVLFSHDPSDAACKKLLEKIDRGYVVFKEKLADGKEHYRLLYVQREPGTLGSDSVYKEYYSLTPDALKKLQDKINKGKPFNFPKSDKPPVALRYKGAALTNGELERIYEVTADAAKFTKDHPEYQSVKQKFPFLKSFTLDETAADQLLLDSIVKDTVKAILDDSRINRTITVKGYANPVHVDTKERRFHISRTHLYPESYVQLGFFHQKDNIDHKKLDEDRRALLTKMINAEIDGNTLAKAIKVIINKKGL